MVVCVCTLYVVSTPPLVRSPVRSSPPHPPYTHTHPHTHTNTHKHTHNNNSFRLANDTFSSARPDAATFGMDSFTQEGLFNLTDLMTAATYFTRPHHRPTRPFSMADVKGIKEYDPEVDDSFIDVEPVMGESLVCVCVCECFCVCTRRLTVSVENRPLRPGHLPFMLELGGGTCIPFPFFLTRTRTHSVSPSSPHTLTYTHTHTQARP